MIKHTDPIVIMGAGSIGERHIGILQKLGFTNIHVYRQRKLPFRTIVPASVYIFTDANEIDRIRPAAAIVCTPTSRHLKQAIFCLERKIPVLIEKPLSDRRAGIEELKQVIIQNKTYAQVAYMLRYHPYFLEIKAAVNAGKLGRLLSMQSCWSEYLPDWHPWEDYRKSYAARKELGGGAALTLSHDIDLMNWLAHSPASRWHTVKNYTAMPELDVESEADISITYENGITANCNLAFCHPISKRSYKFIFEDGHMEMDYNKSELTTFYKDKTTVQVLPEFDRNQLYEAQAIDFFNQIGKEKSVEKALKSIDESETIIAICQ